MADPRVDLADHLLSRLRQVRRELGLEGAEPTGAGTRFADVIDSMGMVEFLLSVAQDCAVTPAVIEEQAGRRFGTVAELAAVLHAAGIAPRREHDPPTVAPRREPLLEASGLPFTCRIAATALRLPETVQPASALDARLHRPAGWLESHAGIRERRVWAEEDPLAAAAAAGRECLDRAGWKPADVGTLLVTSEAPPLLAGLAAALHHRLGLAASASALEVGGACTGFLAALWLARALTAGGGVVLIVAVEAASRWLIVQPDSTGEAAALFGDGAAACAVGAQVTNPEAVPLIDVVHGSDGSAGRLLQVHPTPVGFAELHMDGSAVAHRAIRTMAQAVRDLTRRHCLEAADLAAVVAHGGNGRMPALLARQLGLPAERVWSTTATTGNLGSASVLAAWAARSPAPRGPVAWTAVGAGLTWAAALTGPVQG